MPIPSEAFRIRPSPHIDVSKCLALITHSFLEATVHQVMFYVSYFVMLCKYEAESVSQCAYEQVLE